MASPLVFLPLDSGAIPVKSLHDDAHGYLLDVCVFYDPISLNV
jgi:hypothetical protein